MRTQFSIFLLCVLFFFYKGSAQERLSYEFYNKTERLGIGLVKIEKQLLVIKNQQFNKEIEEDIYSPKHIVPLFFKPDYNIFYVVCLENQKAYYRVLSATGDIYFVPKTQAKFVSWEAFLRNTTGITNLNWEQNPLQEMPSEQSKVIRTKDREATYQVISVKGDWVEIQNEHNAHEKGWIQWRKADSLLIEVYLLI
ncbi:hypothetical protein [uncultured Capnocytophaga sp.]|jgi:hypothetical protein|uniref:hypothetical protein n=1 Tax=uncultured Capnocytophaga sp. TaxID=159273 RepID=UPI00263763BF|nr:hypothetical protein [uncultured Capnocytophaga sp.]